MYSMPEFIVILQEPKHEGNVGAVARCMKNFGFKNLYLINPCNIGDECYKRAKHAKDIIKSAKTFDSLEAAGNEVNFLVGTSGVVNLNDKHHIRNPITPRQFVDHAKQLDSTVGLLFGREDYGLYQEELMLCDLLVTIPANKKYPILNLSHAVGVVLYELASADLKIKIRGHRKTSEFEREKLYKQFQGFLDLVDYPNHKRKHTQILFRRLMGRATPSKWEFHTMMGVFSRANNKIEHTKDSKKVKTTKKKKGKN